MAFASYNKADTWPVIEGQIDVSPLLGHWVNTKTDTDYITELVARRRDGGVVIRLFGSGAAEPSDWGETIATPYMSGRTLEAMGFHARYDFGPIRTLIAANQKLGVLVIQCYTTYSDGSGRHSHFSREFFYRRGGGQ